jgi:hypothetical protein
MALGPEHVKITIRKKESIPMPPSHCVSDLQKRILLGILSSPERTVIPVVVKPLIASK